MAGRNKWNAVVLGVVTSLLVGCSSTPKNHSPDTYRQLRDHAFSTVDGRAGFDAKEAASLLELCVELNNQDDRNNPKLADPEHQYQSRAETDWRPIYDSRHPGNTGWNTIWPWDGKGDNPNDIKTNGLKPLNNAWLLAQSNHEPGHVAIAIRGTVGEWRSILADAYATTTPAYGGIEFPKNKPLPIMFAATPEAEVHLGFAYAAFSLLFDPDQGILTQLQNYQTHQPITQITITGHSQGAAVATLIHAFLHYAIVDENDPYRLAFSTKPSLKSYLFAQPKPGNWQFAHDFARIAGNSAFVINNDRDPVPQVPLSLETVAEVAKYVEEDNGDVKVGGGVLDRIAQSITDAKNSARGSVAELFTGRVADKFKATRIGISVKRFFGVNPTILHDSKANSLNYTLAGQLIPLFGLLKGGDCYSIGDRPDALLQHHATSYRKLIAMQLLGTEGSCRSKF
jgi:hypothetical protein